MEDLVTGRVDVRARAACLWEIKAADSSTVRAALDHSLEPNGGYLDDCVMAEEKCNDWAKDPVSGVWRYWHMRRLRLEIGSLSLRPWLTASSRGHETCWEVENSCMAAFLRHVGK